MKKLILVISLLLIGLVANSQELVKSTIYMPKGAHYLTITGGVMDTVGTAQDSILWPVRIGTANLYKFDVGVYANKRTNADTSIHICVYGKIFENGAWTRIGTTGARSANISGAIYTTFSYGTAVQYNYLRIHVQKTTNLAGASGVKINKVELQLWDQ